MTPERKLVQNVADAWNIPGIMPGMHEAWKIHLRKEWPTLAKAVEELAVNYPPKKSAPPLETDR